MEHRRFGRTGHESSVLAFGAASLGEVTEQVAAESIAEARAAGINHFDTAASYGHAEQVMGPAIEPIRADIFLATKTGMRTEGEAWAEITRSLELLRTDHVDLLQVHAVCDMTMLDEVFAPGGPMPAFERAKAEGLTRFVGITGHTEAAPSTHAEALRRFDFDSVLTPLNWLLYQDPKFADDITELFERAASHDVGIRTIKAVMRRPWQEGEQHYATWYVPFDEQQLTTAAISWVLTKFPQVAAIAPAGETSLLHQAITAEANRISVEEAEGVLAGVPDYKSIFQPA